MDHDIFMHQMEDRFREEFAKALKALEEAPDGHWIDASEMAFRDAALTAAREGLERAVQAKVDAHPTAHSAAFSPPDPEAIGHPIHQLTCDRALVAFDPIPTVSEWGLVVLTLLLLTGAKIYFGRRRAAD